MMFIPLARSDMMRALFDMHCAPDAVQLGQELAEFVAQALTQSLRVREEALLVVSGGVTPVPFFEALSAKNLPWNRVVVTLADERWVPPTHRDSNERVVRQHLLQGPAAQAVWMPLWREGLTPSEALPKVQGELDALPWPASVVVLGMGGDGHTASLFPHDASWVEREQESAANPSRCLAIPAPLPPNAPVSRMTLSPSCLVDAEQIAIHLTGEAKWLVFHQAQAEGPAHDYPIRVALQQRHAPCHVFYSD